MSIQTSPVVPVISRSSARDSYVGRRAGDEPLDVPGEAKILRALHAKSNATRRLGSHRRDRRSHGRNSSW